MDYGEADIQKRKNMKALKGQLTLRGILIGCVGCVIITTSSMYIALKMGALPWPILFAAVVSLFFLKLLGKTNLNEVNVTHTVMSAGAMVAGGIAFTIPGIWIMGATDEVPWWQILVIALSGVALGLVYTAYLRRHFVEKSGLEYPLGEATAQTLVAGDGGGAVGKKLFGAFGFAGIYTFLRDGIGVIPAMLLGNISIPGVAFGIYNSPMLLAVGFLVGTGAIVAWIIGAVFGNFGVVLGGSFFGLWDLDSGRAIASSLGMGVMVGCGVAIIVKLLAQPIRSLASHILSSTPLYDKKESESDRKGVGNDNKGSGNGRNGRDSFIREGKEGDSVLSLQDASQRLFSSKVSAGLAAVIIAAVALVICFVLELGPLPSIIIVSLAWITTAMSAQSVGQTGIDPMEIFGLIVLLVVAALSDVTQVQLFFVAAIIAVACGFTGDLMSDFKAGHKLGTDPRAQSVGQMIGGLLGAFVSVSVISIIVQAYGTDSFGLEGSFIAAQASVVATMVSGIPSLPAFLTGLAIGFVLYLVKLPSMMIGLGIYLPFYMSFAAFFGLVAKLIFNFLSNRKNKDLGAEELKAQKAKQQETGLVAASGLLGGESVISVILALATMGIFLAAP